MRGYINLSGQIKRLHEVDELLASNADTVKLPKNFVKISLDNAALPVYRQSARFVRFFADEFVSFLRFLYKNDMNLTHLNTMPLIIPVGEFFSWEGSKRYEKKFKVTKPADFYANCLVFDNIIIDLTKLRASKLDEMAPVLRGIGITDAGILTPVINEYKKDMKGAAAKKWESPIRVRNTVKRHTIMNIEKVMTRYLEAEKSGISSAKIRDIGERFQVMYKPLDLIFADKPSDFKLMYSEGQESCMTHRDGRDSAWSDLHKNDMHPASWYAYNPRTRGVFIMKGGKIAGRTIIQQDDDGKWGFRRIYSNNNEMHTLFVKMLREHGIMDRTNQSWNPKTDFSFDVPTIKSVKKNDFIAPFPYLDSMKYPDGVALKEGCDPTNPVLTFFYGKLPHKNVSPAKGIGANGFMCVSHINYVRCAYCNDQIGGTPISIYGSDRKYCSNGHAEADGNRYVIMEHRGEHVWMSGNTPDLFRMNGNWYRRKSVYYAGRNFPYFISMDAAIKYLAGDRLIIPSELHNENAGKGTLHVAEDGTPFFCSAIGSRYSDFSFAHSHRVKSNCSWIYNAKKDEFTKTDEAFILREAYNAPPIPKPKPVAAKPAEPKKVTKKYDTDTDTSVLFNFIEDEVA